MGMGDDRRNINCCRFGIACNFVDYSIVFETVAIIAVAECGENVFSYRFIAKL